MTARHILSPEAREAIALAKRLGIKAHAVQVRAGSVTIFDKAGASVIEAGHAITHSGQQGHPIKDRQAAADDALAAWAASEAL